MFLRIQLGFLYAVCGLLTQSAASPQRRPPLLVVSFDGFRADYLQRFPMPNLTLLYSQGVLVEHLTNVFITKTFPNHYSLMTGLYAESHGILASAMYDPVSHKHYSAGNNSDPMWWNAATPFWISVNQAGYTSAIAMWPGSEVAIRNQTPSHFLPYSTYVTFQERLSNVTNWILGSEKDEGALFGAIYWEEPDHSGHMFGPDDTEAMGRALKDVDDNVGLMISELKKSGLWGRIDVMVTSDHGMAQCSVDRLIRLDDCLHADNYTIVDLTPVAALIPNRRPEAVFALLDKCHPNMTAYLKETIPDRLHYRNNERIQPILLIADEGWTIVRHGNKLPRLGDHGYDNSLPSMHPFLAAAGPSFKKGLRLTSMQSVDIYPLMCHLLGVPPQPNNGTLGNVLGMLVSADYWSAPVVVGLVLGVLITLATIPVLFKLIGRLGRPPSLQPFQRLEIEHSDDDEALLE
ncbi:bis(5'-adenosyl)-triphosphatase enpp4 [Nerophis lumbriciformis]|uniref:bis(5'-adenosyl)-triphosphatase enpp4 n=1 Tax=Nerophis lumbriciformis TaxID=546530 RepID=UPI002AE00B38|nr:bis(5'-adenosyl)-triphosphatase enpp4-like [Nerophis lumbriciformis]XP_061840955.1 bis(5'-adenosyl)-triphosphatase enpp4-like [Nerophis lumbriciformis]